MRSVVLEVLSIMVAGILLLYICAEEGYGAGAWFGIMIASVIVWEISNRVEDLFPTPGYHGVDEDGRPFVMYSISDEDRRRCLIKR